MGGRATRSVPDAGLRHVLLHPSALVDRDSVVDEHPFDLRRNLGHRIEGHGLASADAMRVVGVHPNDARAPSVLRADAALPVRQVIRPEANAYLDHPLAVFGLSRLDALCHSLPPLV